MATLSTLLGSQFSGSTGPSGTIAIGAVTSTGDIASVTNVGTSANAVLNFNLPIGTFTWPSNGIPVSLGSSWGTSLTVPTGNLVGTTATQTLTNKTLVIPSITGNTLGSVSGDTSLGQQITIPDTNGTALRFLSYRTGAGTTHDTSMQKIQRRVDVTDMGYIGLGSYYISLGQGITEQVRITSTGGVSFGSSGTAYGISGQILTSTGNSSPVWTNTITNPTITGGTIDGVSIGYRNIPWSGGADKVASYTLATTDIGKFVSLGTSGSITIPASTFSAGDIISLYNNTTGAITITCSAVTTYIGGTNIEEAAVSLATRGICTVFFYSSSVCVITGNVS